MSIYHLGIYNRNVGDTLLNSQIDSFFKESPDFKIGDLRKKKESSVSFINSINKSTQDVLIVGGGGILHEYTEKGERRSSGTLWKINPKEIPQIISKIVFYSVGFNHFYGDKTPVALRETISNIIKQDGIISIRNDGSLNRLIKLFPEFKGNLIEIPDVGVFSRYKIKSNKGYILLQIAGDRIEKRYGNISKLLKIVESLIENEKREIYLIPHTIQDVDLYKGLNIKDYFKKKIKVLPLLNRVEDIDRVLEIYSSAHYTISTRGHSQIISIGNSVPTFPLSSHEKIKGFSNSCGLGEFLFDLKSDPEKELKTKYINFIENIENITKKLISINIEFDKKISDFNKKVLG